MEPHCNRLLLNCETRSVSPLRQSGGSHVDRCCDRGPGLLVENFELLSGLHRTL